MNFENFLEKFRSYDFGFIISLYHITSTTLYQFLLVPLLRHYLYNLRISRAPAPGNYKSNADSRKKLDLSHSPPTSTDQPGARLLAFHNAWRAAPPGFYSITKKGFHWTWNLQPPTLKYPTQITTNQNADLNLAIENLIKIIRAIYQVPLQPCFLSPN